MTEMTITIKVTPDERGDRMHIEVEPATMYPEYVQAILQRASDYYSRRLQTQDTVMTLTSQAAAQNMPRIRLS